MNKHLHVAAPEKYSHIDFTPSAAVSKAAARGLELRNKHGRGGTAVGVARARDLSNGKQLSPSTIKRMKAYFDRHQSDKSGEGWGVDSAGYIAWLLWGGDSGYSWAKKVCKQMDAADNKATAAIEDLEFFCVLQITTQNVLHTGPWFECTQFIREFDKASPDYVDLRVFDLDLKQEYDSHKTTPTKLIKQEKSTVLASVKRRLNQT